MLRTKCIYAPKEDSDGIRVCVMSRLTEDDGRTPVVELVTGNLFDYWSKILAPPDSLVGAWYRQKIDWVRFDVKYKDYLLKDHVYPHVLGLGRMALEKDVTILCVEPTPEHCHRGILARECRFYHKDLEIRVG